jgi:hypothetical protein
MSYQPPKWMRAGAYGDYHSVIGREVTKPAVRLQGDPFKAASGHWVVFVHGISGYVACEALTEVRFPTEVESR